MIHIALVAAHLRSIFVFFDQRMCRNLKACPDSLITDQYCMNLAHCIATNGFCKKAFAFK